jgi:ketosteroid isomerase-like protein
MYMSKDTTETTKAVLAQHLQAVGGGDLDAIAADYSEDCTLFTPDRAFHGLEAARGFFAGMMEILPPGFMEAFELLRQDVKGEVAYIVWHAGEFAPLGTDTFIVRDGKIVVQTFAAYMPPPKA